VAGRWFRAATSQGVLGHLPLLKKGVLQNYAKMELRQVGPRRARLRTAVPRRV
jgi:hypothetical protein